MPVLSSNRFDIDKDAVKTFGIDWSDWLENSTPPAGTIEESIWYPPAAVEVHEDSAEESSTTIRLSIPTGEVGEVYRVRNHIVTSTGDEDDATLILRVVEN